MKLNNIWSGALFLYVVILANCLTLSKNVIIYDDFVPKGNLDTAIVKDEDSSIIKASKDKETFSSDNTNRLVHRQQRSDVVLPDNGYGSRLNTGTNIARHTLRNTVFGAYGPGKRSGFSTGVNYVGHKFVGETGRDAESTQSSKIEHSEGIRRNEEEYTLKRFTWVPSVDKLYARLFNHAKRSEGVLPGNNRRSSYNGDSGYGSRIRAGQQVALGKTAYKDVFGNLGVGK